MPKAGSKRLRPKSSDRVFALLLLMAPSLPIPAVAETPQALYKVVGDAIPRSLTGQPGDPVQGRRIVADRQRGLCLLCHSGPFPEQPLQGNLAPSLAGAANRWSIGQLRLRIVDAGRVSPGTIMPTYYRSQGLVQVAPDFAGKPILTAEQIEDVVAYLATLRQ